MRDATPSPGPAQFTPERGHGTHVFRLTDRFNLDLQVQSTQHVQPYVTSSASWNTTINSPLFGLPTATARQCDAQLADYSAPEVLKVCESSRWSSFVIRRRQRQQVGQLDRLRRPRTAALTFSANQHSVGCGDGGRQGQERKQRRRPHCEQLHGHRRRHAASHSLFRIPEAARSARRRACREPRSSRYWRSAKAGSYANLA